MRAGSGVGFRLLPLARPGQTVGDALMAEREQQDRHIYRRCPSCSAVRQAADFKRATGKPDFGQDRPTRCPECGHVARAWAFHPVAPPARTEGGGG
jgi:hypothetical protein